MPPSCCGRLRECCGRYAEAEGLDRPNQSVGRWLKKAGGVLVVPRSSHSKKDPAVAEGFRLGLAEKLESLELPAGSRVKLWMMDEARFGLHTQLCRLWACKGHRPVVTRQIKYQCGYLYGSLDVIGSQPHFFQSPSVNQEGDALYLKYLKATDPMPSISAQGIWSKKQPPWKSRIFLKGTKKGGNLKNYFYDFLDFSASH